MNHPVSDADARLVRRTASLQSALASLGPDASYAAVAALAASPGFRGGPDPDDPVLAQSRQRCREHLAALLPAAPPVREPEVLAHWLTGIRPDLVHPMTGEQMCPLDWVLRGGDLASAQSVSSRPPAGVG